MKDFRNGVDSCEKAKLSEIKATELLEGATYAGGVPNGKLVYDLDWMGKKVEVKMSTTYPIWTWMVRDGQAKAADYILLMGYDQNVFKTAFFVPKEEFGKRDNNRGLGFRISAKTLHNSMYAKYEVIIGSKYKVERIA